MIKSSATMSEQVASDSESSAVILMAHHLVQGVNEKAYIDCVIIH